MNSPVGHNAINVLYGVGLSIELLQNGRLSNDLLYRRFKDRLTPKIVAHADVLKELLLLRDEQLFLPLS